MEYLSIKSIVLSTETCDVEAQSGDDGNSGAPGGMDNLVRCVGRPVERLRQRNEDARAGEFGATSREWKSDRC